MTKSWSTWALLAALALSLAACDGGSSDEPTSSPSSATSATTLKDACDGLFTGDPAPLEEYGNLAVEISERARKALAESDSAGATGLQIDIEDLRAQADRVASALAKYDADSTAPPGVTSKVESLKRDLTTLLLLNDITDVSASISALETAKGLQDLCGLG